MKGYLHVQILPNQWPLYFSIPPLQNSPRETNILQILNNWSGDDTLVMGNLGASDVKYV